MFARASLVLAIVTGGVGLGTLLGSAANPQPKRPPDPPWLGATQATADDAAYPPAAADAWQLTPYRESSAPSWAGEELADWEPPYPEWSYSDWSDEPAAAPDAQPDEVAAAEAVAHADSEAPEALAPEPPTEGNLDALY